MEPTQTYAYVAWAGRKGEEAGAGVRQVYTS